MNLELEKEESGGCWIAILLNGILAHLGTARKGDLEKGTESKWLMDPIRNMYSFSKLLGQNEQRPSNVFMGAGRHSLMAFLSLIILQPTTLNLMASYIFLVRKSSATT